MAEGMETRMTRKYVEECPHCHGVVQQGTRPEFCPKCGNRIIR